MLNMIQILTKEVFIKSLEVMYKGMIAIFIALGIIFLFILIFNKMDSKK